MLIRSWENQEWLSSHLNRILIVFLNIEIKVFILSEKKNLSILSCFKNIFLSGHIFNMLHNKVYRNPVISGAWNNQISIANSRIDKVPESVFDKFIILSQNANNSSTPFDSISLDPSAQPNIIYI